MRLRSILFVFLFCFAGASASAQCTSTLEQEYQALMALYQSTNGSSWTNNTGWSTADPNVLQSVVGWYGVITNATGRVIELQLSGNQLTGILPVEIGNLECLQKLDLSTNQLTGQLTIGIGNLANLEQLHLSANNFQGSIPGEFGNLINLKQLHIRYCNLGGAIPASIGNLSLLKSFAADQNNFSGELPSEIGNLTQLEGLNLSYNQLTGTLPVSMGNLVNLIDLELHNNQITGSIPDEIVNLINLKYLYLNNNQLSGPIPTGIGNMVQLIQLLLHTNQLTGQLPNSIGNLANLEELSLTGNSFHGSIPSEVGNLINLKQLHIRLCNLSGSIPASIGNLSLLKSFAADQNNFSGELPGEIGNLTQLEGIDLSYNQITGQLPSSIGGMVSLKNLAMANNQLSGQIPEQMGNLTNLQHLYLNNNQLKGPLPSAFSNSDALISISFQYNNFTFSDFITLKQNKPTATFNYSVQGPIDEEKTVNAPSGQSLTLTASIDRNTSPESVYQWFKVVNGGTPTALNTPSASGHTVVIENVSEADAGTKYYYTITNTAAPGLTLKSHDQTFQLITCTTPTLNFQSEELNGTHTFTPVFTGENCTPTFTWDFGDGTTSQDQAASHGYTTTGTFTVTLTVNYDCGPCPSGQLISTHEVIIENGFCGSIYCDDVGGVGIGTRNTEGFRLSVNGKIRASDIIKVYPQNQWSDFVFEKDYKLRPLSEVESFIKENGHLPEVPSAKEVETQGIDLGAMDAKLLQKIEELTLYLIELKKENEAMKKEIKTLRSKRKSRITNNE